MFYSIHPEALNYPQLKPNIKIVDKQYEPDDKPICKIKKG